MKPEVNKECEVSILGQPFKHCLPRFLGEHNFVLDFPKDNASECIFKPRECEFRPIKTPVELQVDAMVADIVAGGFNWSNLEDGAKRMVGLGWCKRPARPAVDFTTLYAEFREALPGGMPYTGSDFVVFLNSTVEAYRK